MGKIFFAIVAVVASAALVEALSCNKCSFGLLGVCPFSQNVTCAENTSVCFTGKISFSSIAGFNTQGCKADSVGCDATSNSSLLGVAYETKITCCSTNNCNPVTVSGAPSPKMTFTAAIGGAILASVLGSML